MTDDVHFGELQSTLVQPEDNLLPSQDRYTQDRYTQDRYTQDRYTQDRYTQDRYIQDRYIQDRHFQDRNGHFPYVQDPYAQDRNVPARHYGQKVVTEMVIGPWYLDEFGNPTRQIKARD
jgi:hypothetical protein